MVICAVIGCNNNNNRKRKNNIYLNETTITFHTFPKDNDVRKIWMNKCRRKDEFNSNTARICSVHFRPDHYERDLKSELLNYEPRIKRLKKDAFPTEHLPKSDSGNQTTAKRTSRNEKRDRKKFVRELLLNEPSTSSSATAIENDHLTDSLPSNEVEAVSFNEANKIKLLEEENCALKSENANLMQQVSKLISESYELKQQVNYLESIFTPGQIKKMRKSSGTDQIKRVTWCFDDISKALALHSAGPRAYRYILKKKYPLPAVSTLKKWANKISVRPGLLNVVINILKNSDLSSFDKVCVLLADEMKVKEQYEYDEKNDTLLHPSKFAQVIEIRGLFRNWKQPVFYQFDCKLTKNLIFKIITRLENIGYNIVAMVSDLGGGNRGLWNELKVNENNNYFLNPVTQKKLYVFGDAPHLVKLVRNHFLDSGFSVDGNILSKCAFLELMQQTASSLNIAYKVTERHLNVKNAERQKVKLATQLFSHTNSVALKRLGDSGLITSKNWNDLSSFIKLVNDWFDVFNCKVPTIDSRKRMSAYGLQLDTQNKILEDMKSNITKMRVITKKGVKKNLLPFQKGIIMSIRSLKMLFKDMQAEYKISYLITNRLNQDILEGLFSIMRYNGGLHDHPSPLEFKYRLRNYILGRNDGAISSAANVEDQQDSEEIMITDNNFQTISSLPDEAEITGEETMITRNALCDLNTNSNDTTTSNMTDSMDLEDDKIGAVELDGLESVGGFIANKLKKKYPHLGTVTADQHHTYVDQLSEGFLYKPTDEFLKNLSKLWKIFQIQELKRKKCFISSLLEDSCEVDVPEEVKKLFFKTVMYFSIKTHNSAISDAKIHKRKLQKTAT